MVHTDPLLGMSQVYCFVWVMLPNGCVIIFYYKLWMIQKYLGFVTGSFAFTFNYFVRSSFPSIEYGIYFHSSPPQSLGVTLSSYLSFQWCIPCSSLFGFIYYLKHNYIEQQELRPFESEHRLTVLSEMPGPTGFSTGSMYYVSLLVSTWSSSLPSLPSSLFSEGVIQVSEPMCCILWSSNSAPGEIHV